MCALYVYPLLVGNNDSLELEKCTHNKEATLSRGTNEDRSKREVAKDEEYHHHTLSTCLSGGT